MLRPEITLNKVKGRYHRCQSADGRTLIIYAFQMSLCGTLPVARTTSGKLVGQRTQVLKHQVVARKLCKSRKSVAVKANYNSEQMDSLTAVGTVLGTWADGAVECTCNLFENVAEKLRVFRRADIQSEPLNGKVSIGFNVLFG